MIGRYALAGILIVLLLAAPGFALEFRSGNEVIVNDPIDDDLVVSAGQVIIDAPVGSVIAAGGEVRVRAPVKGDVIAAGGLVVVDAEVGGKIVAAGGTVQVNGNATNALVAGGEIDIGRDAMIRRDAYLSGGTVRHAGRVAGILGVSAETFENTGSAGSVRFEQQERDGGIDWISIFITLGFAILGLILLTLLPGQFAAVEAEVRNEPIKHFLIGLGVVIVGGLVLVVMAMTVVLLPTAVMLGMLYLAAVLLASIVVGAAIGTVIQRYFPSVKQTWLFFLAGFVLLHLLFAIPILGFLIRIIATGLGVGALIAAAQRIRGARPGENAPAVI